MDNKKIYLAILFVVLSPAIVFASVRDINSLFGTITLYILWVVFGGIVVVSFVISAITFLTAMGNPEKINQAKTALVWGVVGVVVGIVAYSIIMILSKILQS